MSIIKHGYLWKQLKHPLVPAPQIQHFSGEIKDVGNKI